MTALSTDRIFSLAHLFVLSGVLLFHSLNFTEALRVALYANLLIVVYHGWKHKDLLRGFHSRGVLTTCFVLLLLTAFHMLAVEKIEVTKEIRNMVVYVAFLLGIFTFLVTSRLDKEGLKKIAITLMAIYVFIQATAVFFLGLKHGTTKNPHYLAQYCLLFLPVCVYLFCYSSKPLKIIAIACIPLLLTMLLKTSSRPAWIGLILISGMAVLHQRRMNRLLCFFAITAIFAVLYLANIENFGARLHELYLNIQTEERVYIWNDALAMQQGSSLKHWLFGHGLGSFRNDFIEYSSYHQTAGIDFNSPHNFAIELLYTSGIFGLIVVVAFFFVFYFRLFATYIKNHHSDYVFLLISLLTANLVLVSITLPFFTSYNLIVCSLVGGLFLGRGSDQAESRVQ